MEGWCGGEVGEGEHGEEPGFGWGPGTGPRTGSFVAHDTPGPRNHSVKDIKWTYAQVYGKRINFSIGIFFFF